MICLSVYLSQIREYATKLSKSKQKMKDIVSIILFHKGDLSDISEKTQKK